jgi:hypothetical protein
MRFHLALVAAALLLDPVARAEDALLDQSLGQDLDTSGLLPGGACPTGHQLLWTLSASLGEISKAVLQMREQVAVLEHNVRGLLGVEGDATLQIRAPTGSTSKADERFVLALTQEAVELNALARGLAGQLVVAQDNAATAFRTLGGDATLDADGVLDLGRGAVSLDEIEQLDEAELIIGTPCDRAFGETECKNNNTRVQLSGDVRLAADGEVRVLPNALQLSQLVRGGGGQLLVGQGQDADSEYKTLLGDATLAASGALLLRENVVTDYHIAPGVVQTEHLARELVITDSLGPACVTREKVATNSIDTDAIIDGSVTSADLADNSISTEKLAPHPDGVDGEGQLFMYGADGRLERTRVRHDASLMAGGVLTIQNDAISSAKIADGAVIADKLADYSVTERSIAPFSVTYDKLRLTEGFPPFEKDGTVGESVDVVTMLNTARGPEMIGTEGRLLFQQYYRGAVDEMSQQDDAGAVGVGAETNWGPTGASRDAYVALHAVTQGVMVQRAKFGASVTRLGPELSTQAADGAVYRVEVGGTTALTAKCASCGDGGALQLQNAEAQTSGSLVHLSGTTGQAALKIAAGNVEVDESLIIGGTLSVATLAPTEIAAAGTAGGALILRNEEAQTGGDLFSIEGTAGQSALRVAAGNTQLGGTLVVDGAATLCELPDDTAVLTVSTTSVAVAKPLLAAERVEASSGLVLTGGALDTSGNAAGLDVVLPADMGAALTVGALDGEDLLTLNTATGITTVSSLRASGITALDGRLDLSLEAEAVVRVAVNAPTALTVRSEVLGIQTDHLVVDAAADTVGVSTLHTESLQLGLATVTASDGIVIPVKSVVRVLPDDADPLTETDNWFTLLTPGAAGHMLLLSNHADAALRDSNGKLADLPAGYAGMYVFLGSGVWMQVSSQAIPEDNRLLTDVDEG